MEIHRTQKQTIITVRSTISWVPPHPQVWLASGHTSGQARATLGGKLGWYPPARVTAGPTGPGGGVSTRRHFSLGSESGQVSGDGRRLTCGPRGGSIAKAEWC